MKYRRLLIAWSVAWGVVAVLLFLLWFRSHTWCDVRAIPGHKLMSLNCKVYFDEEVSILYSGPDAFAQPNTISSGLFTMSIKRCFVLPKGGGYYAPYWSLILFAVVLSSASWLPLKFRFSLRTLLIVTTLVALLLGLFVWLR